MSGALLLAVGGLTSVGIYLIMARSLSQIILGFSLLGHATVLGFLVAGGASGDAPIASSGAVVDLSNPLPQALALTAIVISFGLTLFLLALAVRQQQLTRDDLVEDDLEDQRVALGAPTEEPQDVMADLAGLEPQAPVRPILENAVLVTGNSSESVS
ncbi:MAG: sodium:proton antiporter [Acidimicrobiia bacterium]|nr:sodium:proton antiporter [Acidimicrobiia bacterium]